MKPVHPRSDRPAMCRTPAVLIAALLLLLPGAFSGTRATAASEPADPPKLPLWPDLAPDGRGGLVWV